VADIEDHDGTVVASSGDERWFVGVEVNAHDTGLGRELVLWPREVLNCVAADETSLWGQEII